MGTVIAFDVFLNLYSSKQQKKRLFHPFPGPRCTNAAHKRRLKRPSWLEGIKPAIKMKSWAILALLVSSYAVSFAVGRTEEIAQLGDFEEPFEDQESKELL